MAEKKLNIQEILEKLKTNVRSSNRFLLVGIDIAKRKHCACFILSNGQILSRRFFFYNDKGGFESLIRQIQNYSQKHHPEGILIAMEPSGDYWRHIDCYLSNHGLSVVHVNPLCVCRNRETIDVSKDKSDPKDAYNIADLLMQGKFHFPVQRDKTISQLKQLMNIYYRLITEKSKLRNRLKQVVGYFFPELECYFKDITSKTALAILEKYPFPEQITSISVEEFKSYIKEHNRTFSHKKIEEIYNLAKESVGIKGEEETNLFEMELLLHRLYSIEGTIITIKSKVDKIVKDREDYKLLLTLKGIGPIFAASIIAETGDISNFTSGKQLIKLAGLDLFGQQSGDSLHTLKHITKRGRKQLRTIMYQAAISCVRLNPQLKLKYQQLLENQSGKRKKTGKALIAIACKLLRIIFRMLIDNKKYDTCYDDILRSKLAA